MVNSYPGIFSLPWKKIDAVVQVFKKCLFTVAQVTEILRSCPSVLLEEPHDLEYKFQVRLGLWGWQNSFPRGLLVH